jgi:hypothetical protein
VSRTVFFRSVGLWVAFSVASASPSQAQPVTTTNIAIESANWTPIAAPSVATARAASVFIYDEARQNCVVFGGRPVDDRGRSLGDTGIWSGATWVPVAAEYGHRGYVSGVFDSLRQRTVVYGGTDGLALFADTWEFDGSAWSRRAVGSPSGRSGNGLAYDSLRGVTVLFGGDNGRSAKADLWEWDGSAWREGCTAPPCIDAPHPAARAGAVFVYDKARNVSLLFGGAQDGQAYDDMWSWDGVGWNELHPPHVPPARAHAAATYDPVTKRVLLFGGLAAGLQELGDFWAWDGHDWSQIAQTTMPFARHGAGMAWHAKARRGILFGGSAGGKQTDAWEFQLFGTRCATSDDCHVGTCVQGACPTDPSAPGSAGAGDPAAGGSGGMTSSGGAGGADGLGGCSCTGGKPTSADAGAMSAPGPPPAANGGTAADPGGVNALPPAPSLQRDETAPAQSFYSCAVSAPSSSRAPLALHLVLAALVSWLTRRRHIAG